MRISSRRKQIAFFISSGVLLVAVAVGLNVGWILLTPKEVLLIIVGILLFGLIIAGLILNTIFLVREIRRNEQHDSFINAVTHELKTPIASIRLYLETLQTREVNEAKRQEFYQIMLADSERLLATVEQVLRAGRTGHKRRHINLANVDLLAVAEECVELARRRYPSLSSDALQLAFDKGLRFAPPLVRGDADELRAAVANLIDNAVKYSENNVRVRVAVETAEVNLVRVKVSDEGAGIPANQLKRIFKRFHRVPLPIMMRVKGTGLGLFIVQAIIKKHRGRVFAESKGVGRGSTFTISLPRLSPAIARTLSEQNDSGNPIDNAAHAVEVSTQ